jgi:hypothetical protein
MTVLLSPLAGAGAQFFDNDGIILAGGKIYTYAAGTNTPQATYTTIAGTIAHNNPIILDASGRVPGGEIWLTSNLAYKLVIKDANNTLIGTYDNLTGISNLTLPINATQVNYTAPFGGAVQETVAAKLAQTVSVKDFGAVGDNTNDDTSAFIAALTASNSVYVPTGTYKITASLTFNGRVYGDGPSNSIINYIGTGFCFEHTTNDGAVDLGISGLGINVSGASASGICVGNYNAAISLTYFVRVKFSDLYIYGDGSDGSKGMSMTQAAAGSFTDIQCQNFDYGFIFDRTTANQMRRLRAQGFNYGFTWTGQTTPQACGQDSIEFLDILGPGGAKPTGYGLLMDAPQNWSSNVYYECTPGATFKTNLWVTANGYFYKEFASTYTSAANVTNPVLIDAGCSEVCFVGTHMLADSTPKASVGQPSGPLGGFNGTHQLVACGTQFVDIFSTTTLGYISSAGSGKLSPPGLVGAPQYIYETKDTAMSLPPQLYSGNYGSYMSASSTVGDSTPGKISMGTGAGTSPPTPVVQTGSNDLRGTVTFGTGALPSGNTVVNINFNKTMASKPHVLICVESGTSTAVQLMVGQVGLSGFNVSAIGSLAASQPSDAYSFSYFVIG